MAYSEEKTKRLTDLLGEIEGRKKHEYAAAIIRLWQLGIIILTMIVKTL